MFRKRVSTLPTVYKIFKRTCKCPCHPSQTPPCTKMTILQNGVRVATSFTNSPLACLALFVEAGSRFEISCNNGITHFVEHMAYRGFNSMSSSELENLLQSIGAKMSAHTSREIQIFSAKCLVENLPTLIEILGSIITNLALEPCEMDIERKKIEQELTEIEKNPKAVLFDYLHQTAFQGTPLAKRVIGKIDNLPNFDKSTVSSFITDHYQPYKLALVAVGNIQHDAVVAKVQNELGHMKGDPCCESDEGPTRFTGSQVQFRDDSMPFAHVALAFEVPGYNTSDYYPLMAAKAMIGSWHKGIDGQLKNAIKLARAGSVSDICDSYEAFYIPYRDIGLWGVYYVSKRMVVDDMMYNVQNALMETCSIIQHYDGERAVNALKLDYARNCYGGMRACNDLGYQTMYNCGQAGLSDIYHELKGVTFLRIKNTLEKWVYDRCPAVASVGPSEALQDYTRIRAGQYWLRL